MRKLLVLLSAAAALVAMVAVLASSASAGDKARASQGFNCPKFTVVVTDVEAGFPRGTYNRLNFAPDRNQSLLSCDYSFHVFRSYLYHPDSHRGWSVQRLRGELKNRTGKRFLLNGSDGKIGFDVYK